MRIAGNRARALGIAAVAVLLWSAGGAGGAGVAAATGDVTELGWWSRNPLSSAPDGGFAVGAAPDGVTAVAAVRVDLGGGVDTLVLEVEPADDGIALGSLEVCVGPDTWSAAAGGALDDAPATACDASSVPFAEAGGGWRADVSSLVQGASGDVSLAVVPVAGSGTVPFEVTFAAPTARATGAVPATRSGPDAPAPSASPAPAPAPSPSVSPSPPPAPRAAGPITAPAVAPAPAPAPTTSAPPAPEPAEGDASSAIELASAGVLDDVAAGDPRWGEALVLVLIGVGVGAVVYATSRVTAARATAAS